MLLCFLSVTFWQCQKEELETNEPHKQGKLKLWVAHGEKVFNDSKKLRERVTSLKRRNIYARLTSTIYNFSIDEEHVQVIVGDDYTQYTFNVERDNPTPNLLENYVCKIYTDGEVFQYLMGYPYTIGQNGITYQMQNSTIQVISDENIAVTTAGRGFPPGCVPEFLYEVLTYQCTNYSCGGAGHLYGDHNCECGKTVNCSEAYQICGWITTAIYGGCGGGGSGGDSGDGGLTPPAGGGSGGSGGTPSEPIVTIPFEDFKDPIKECENIKKLLDENPIFRDSIKNIAATALTATSEKAVTLKSDGTISVINGVNSKVTVTQTPINKYKALFHIHNGNQTYSIYSLHDLIWTAQVHILHSKIDTRNFVSFLATGKGTYYAFTINDIQKFQMFFDFVKHQKTSITPQERTEYLNKLKLNSFMFDKFFSWSEPHPTFPLIKENSIDNNEVDLENFMSFLAEGNIGISVFETNANFDTFSIINKNPIVGDNSVIKTPCGN